MASAAGLATGQICALSSTGPKQSRESAKGICVIPLQASIGPSRASRLLPTRASLTNRPRKRADILPKPSIHLHGVFEGDSELHSAPFHHPEGAIVLACYPREDVTLRMLLELAEASQGYGAMNGQKFRRRFIGTDVYQAYSLFPELLDFPWVKAFEAAPQLGWFLQLEVCSKEDAVVVKGIMQTLFSDDVGEFRGDQLKDCEHA